MTLLRLWTIFFSVWSSRIEACGGYAPEVNGILS